MNTFNFKQFLERRKEEKKTKLRMKNDALRAQGKEPTSKGWGKLVKNSPSNPTVINSFDNKGAFAEKQKNVGKKIE